jgi:acyl-CoA synthetase (AMP-forming)/AMP-acid ligase II
VGAGVQAGDRVAIWAPNGVRWIVAVHGLWQAGATLIPINTLLYVL